MLQGCSLLYIYIMTTLRSVQFHYLNVSHSPLKTRYRDGQAFCYLCAMSISPGLLILQTRPKETLSCDLHHSPHKIGNGWETFAERLAFYSDAIVIQETGRILCYAFALQTVAFLSVSLVLRFSM